MPELDTFAGSLQPDVIVEVDRSQIFQRSTEPPSWVALLAEAEWWVQGLAAYAALFVAELVKEAAKDTWRNRGKAVAAATLVGSQLRKIGDAIGALRRRLSNKTTIAVGLPIPNEYFATRLRLEGNDSNFLCAQLALFIHHLPALNALITKHGLDKGRVGTGIFLELRDDGSLLVSWHDPDSLEVIEHVLPLTAG